jgi:hypothetical protein
MFTLEPNFKVFNSTKQQRSSLGHEYMITRTWTVGQQRTKTSLQQGLVAAPSAKTANGTGSRDARTRLVALPGHRDASTGSRDTRTRLVASPGSRSSLAEWRWRVAAR